MTLIRLGVSLLLLLAALVVVTLWRAGQREQAAEAAAPPEGVFVTVEGIRVHAVQKGQGPDIVLLHGASGNLRDLTFALLPKLAERYRVTALDRPGLGYSDPLPGGNTSLAEQARLLSLVLAELGVRRPVLVGHSFGGSVALAWAVTRPSGTEVAALVTIAGPSLPWPGELDPWYRVNRWGVVRAVTVPLVTAFLPQGYVEGAVGAVFAPQAPSPGYLERFGPMLATRRQALAQNLAHVNGLRDQLVAMEPDYAALTLPFEMVHGDADTIVPLNVHSGPLAARLPDATLTVIPGAGHMPHHAHQDVVIDAIDRAAARAGLR